MSEEQLVFPLDLALGWQASYAAQCAGTKLCCKSGKHDSLRRTSELFHKLPELMSVEPNTFWRHERSCEDDKNLYGSALTEE